MTCGSGGSSGSSGGSDQHDSSYQAAQTGISSYRKNCIEFLRLLLKSHMPGSEAIYG